MGPGYGAGGRTDGNISLSGVVGVKEGRREVLEGNGLFPAGADAIATSYGTAAKILQQIKFRGQRSRSGKRDS